MILERNRKVLTEQYSGLLETITSDSDDDLLQDDIKIEMTPIGEPTLRVRGISIHSQRDPLREGQRLAESVRGENGAVVILGFGLGYTAQAAAKLGRPLIIAEKHKRILLKAFELRDFSGFLSKNRIIFVIGGSGEGITNALDIASEYNQQPEKRISVIRNKALAELDQEWYGAVDDRIRVWTMKDTVNKATHIRFGYRWARNFSRNMSAIRDFPGVSRLAGLAVSDNPLPVFLAAAGPSLDKVKPLLRDIHDRCVIVAVDTSLRFFVQNGIPPDFVVAVDPQFLNNRHFDRCVCEAAGAHTALIADSAVYPPVLRLPFKNKFLCGSMFPPGEHIEKQVDLKGRLSAGGSVATTAWDFARTLGCREIWIAGLDLAFPDLKTHFKGARFEALSNSQSCRFNPSEKWIMRTLRGGFPFKVRKHASDFSAGEQVLTDKRLSLYAAWFENQFRQHPQIQNFCLFQDGLPIAGLKTAEVEKFLALPKRRDEINTRIKTTYSKIEMEFNDPREKLKRNELYEKAVSASDVEL